MTAIEFEAIRPFLHISRERIDAARAATVDGVSYQSIAEPYGWTRQAVNDAVGVVWRKFEEYRASQQAASVTSLVLPPGWEQVTLIAPTSFIEKVRAQLAELSMVETSEPERVRNGRKRR